MREVSNPVFRQNMKNIPLVVCGNFYPACQTLKRPVGYFTTPLNLLVLNILVWNVCVQSVLSSANNRDNQLYT